MKIDKITTYKTKILKLKLIKTKVYKKSHNNFINIEDIYSRIKKALHIIYNYHINNKKILFVGTSMQTYIISKFKKLFYNTKHTIIPEYAWVSGVLTNRRLSFKDSLKNSNTINNKTSKTSLQLKKKSDLIVILDSFSSEKVSAEASIACIPTISLNYDFKLINNNLNYKIPGNFKLTKKQTKDTFFFSILAATLKKAQKDCKLNDVYNKQSDLKHTTDILLDTKQT